MIYFGSSENERDFDQLVLRLSKEYVFLKLRGEEEFKLIKSLFEEEDYIKGQLLIARNFESRIEKKKFKEMNNFEEIVKYLEILHKSKSRKNGSLYDPAEL